MRFQADGFLVINENAEIVRDSDFCRKIVRDFYIWHQIYFRPVRKYIPLKKQYFSMLRQLNQSSLDNCKRRYENNLYKNGDPAKKAYSQVLKELDLDVIQNNSLLLKNLDAVEKIIDIEKSIWQRCSCEKSETLKRILIEYQHICIKMVDYTANRGKIFYQYEQAIKDAYKIDLQVSNYSILSKLALSFLLWLANTNMYALAVPFLPEVLKWFYQTLAGSKSLLKKSKHYLKKIKEIASLIQVLQTPVENSKIRNLT
ncbi:MAG: hypothetical protein COS84_03980 [Armatimonadetes bacterium CG07_land_8_20_14_0_80_40_9]|nr:MAG: hypothetical protein COS84_03980 [Armatimonadetes bacterium CG07_land_8_20_14_0_80_40_9]